MEDSKEIIIRINQLSRREAFANELLIKGYTVHYHEEKDESPEAWSQDKNFFIVATKE